MAPRQLVMNIFITFDIPFGKVSLAAIEEAVRQSLKELGRLMIKTLLEALQERLSFMLQALHPERFVKNGRHGRLRTFNTSFGKVRLQRGRGRDAGWGEDGYRGLENRELVDLLSEIPLFRLKIKERPWMEEKAREGAREGL